MIILCPSAGSIHKRFPSQCIELTVLTLSVVLQSSLLATSPTRLPLMAPSSPPSSGKSVACFPFAMSLLCSVQFCQVVSLPCNVHAHLFQPAYQVYSASALMICDDLCCLCRCCCCCCAFSLCPAAPRVTTAPVASPRVHLVALPSPSPAVKQPSSSAPRTSGPRSWVPLPLLSAVSSPALRPAVLLCSYCAEHCCKPCMCRSNRVLETRIVPYTALPHQHILHNSAAGRCLTTDHHLLCLLVAQ